LKDKKKPCGSQNTITRLKNINTAGVTAPTATLINPHGEKNPVIAFPTIIAHVILGLK